MDDQEIKITTFDFGFEISFLFLLCCIQSINDLASALSKVRLDPNTLIRICWPKDLCSLLRDDVVLVDRLILLSLLVVVIFLSV